VDAPGQSVEDGEKVGSERGRHDAVSWSGSGEATFEFGCWDWSQVGESAWKERPGGGDVECLAEELDELFQGSLLTGTQGTTHRTFSRPAHGCS